MARYMHNTPPYWDSVQLLLAKYFRTNSVETRMDPGQLVCQKQASLDLYCFQDRVYVKLTQCRIVLSQEC